MNNIQNVAALRREIMCKLGVTRMSDEAFADYAGIHVNTLKRALNGQNGGKLIADEKIEPAVIKDLTLALLRGALIVKKLPWEPKKGDVYCRPGNGFEDVDFDNWGNHPIDFALKEAGMVFKTYEECEAALPELRKKYLGGDDNG